MTRDYRRAGQAPDGELRRAISGRMLLFFIIGDVLGAGIYALVGEVGGRIGGAIWVAFAVALLLALFTAFAYAELVTKYPQAAGAALYVNKAFRRPFVTFLVAFAVMCSGLASAATLARAFGGDYLSEFVSLPTALVGLGFIAVMTLVNFRGIAESVKLNVGLTMIELVGLLLVVLIGAAALLERRGRAVARAGVHRRRGGAAGDHGRRRAGVLRAHRLRGLGERRRGDPGPAPQLTRGRCSAACSSPA